MFSHDLQNKYPEAVKFLTNAIKKGRLANSYVFIGKDSNEISLIVKELAKILNCNQSPPCNTCLNCKWIEEDKHPQALNIVNPDTTSKKEQIKVDTVRELMSLLNTSSDSYRIVFFKNASLNHLPRESCNLLLKTVEETPARVMFIFANTSRNDILTTILSRSQTIYISKHYDSLANMTSYCDSQENALFESFTNQSNFLTSAKLASEYISENKVNISDYLTELTVKSYQAFKETNPKRFCTLHKSLSTAQSKAKAFMQPKIIIEDLFLSLNQN